MRSDESDNFDSQDDEALDTDSEDVVLEVGEIGTEEASNRIEKLRKQLKKCKLEREEYLSGWQRAQADYVNLKKDESARLEKLLSAREKGIFHELLAVLDSFDQARGDKTAWEAVPANWRSGVEYIQAQLLSVLGSYGVRELDSLGKEFDPRLHESTSVVPQEDKEMDGKVLRVLQKGYAHKEGVLRPARVEIGVYKGND